MLGSAILITGIGCIGKSTLRRRIQAAHSVNVVTTDRDDPNTPPVPAAGQILVVEAVHGLDEPPDQWGLVVYLMPPPGHALRWLRRGFVWFRTGSVDRPFRVVRRPYSLLNLPVIIRLVARNIWNAKRWVSDDLLRIEALFGDEAVITPDADQALWAVERFLSGTNPRSTRI